MVQTFAALIDMHLETIIQDTDLQSLHRKFKTFHSSLGLRIEPRLFDIIKAAYKGHLSEPIRDSSTTDRLDYLERLLDELLDSNSLDHPINGLAVSSTVEPQARDISRDIEDTLWLLNFNYRPYFLYCIDRIAGCLAREETLMGKLEALAYEHKKVSQISCQTDARYTDKYPSLRDIVLTWIDEESTYLEKKRQLTLSFGSHETHRPNTYKIALDLSVAQFTCLVRGLVERKVILNTNLTELSAFLSKTFITKRSENISEGSFRRKYYNIEDATRQSVVDQLNRLIDWLMKS